jgi:hypothetical protein
MVATFVGIAQAGAAAVISNEAAIRQAPKPTRQEEKSAESDCESILNIQIFFNGQFRSNKHGCASG